VKQAERKAILRRDFFFTEKALDALWRHYKQVTVDWSSQPALLPQHWQDTEIIYR
jgi:hypothetical protein